MKCPPVPNGTLGGVMQQTMTNDSKADQKIISFDTLPRSEKFLPTILKLIRAEGGIFYASVLRVLKFIVNHYSVNTINIFSVKQYTMKKFLKYFISPAAILVTMLLLSWDKLDRSAQTSSSIKSVETQNYSSNFFSDELVNAWRTENDWDRFDEAQNNLQAAEDVLIQKIPGDHQHLLMMAYYSKENYPGAFVIVHAGSNDIVFRDDGNGDDKTADDGFFTAKISADVNQFREMAVKMSDDMKSSGYKPVRYLDRSMF